MSSPAPPAALGGPARSGPRALLAALAVGGVLGLSACEDRSVSAGVNAAHQDAENRVDEAAAKVGDAIENVAGHAQDLAANAVDETKAALDEAKPRAERLADQAGEKIGDLADATGNAAIRAGNKVADVGRDAKRRAAEREALGNRSD